MQLQHRFVLFADIKGFSKIDNARLPALMGDVWTRIASILDPHKGSILTYNTWGDALFLVFSGAGVVGAVLEIRDWFRSHSTLAIRIACHFGDFFEYQDPILERVNAVGANINLTARIEPVTRPNAIFVTREFREALIGASDPEKPAGIEFDELGEVALAKNFGSRELFLLRRSSEKPHILDRLSKMDLSKALPDIAPIRPDQQLELEGLRGLTPGQLRRLPKFEPDSGGSDADYGRGLAKLHQDRGNYDVAQEISDGLLEIKLDADGLEVQPLAHDPGFIKLRANIATRRGDYDQAHQLLYGLYRSGAQDTDTLTMLASCYKRRAFFHAQKERRDEPSRPLLERSRDLYLEAVRKDIGDHYPVINAAYAHAFLRQDGYANKLAEYCQELLRETHDRGWWPASTFAETEVVRSDYEEAERLLIAAIAEHQPKPFEMHALLDQLELLAIVRSHDSGLRKLILAIRSLGPEA